MVGRLLEVEGEEGTGHHGDVHDVPDVPHVGAGVQEQAKVQHFQQGLDGKDSGEPVIQHAQLLVPVAVLLRTQYVGSRISN